MGFLCRVFTKRTPGRYLGAIGSPVMERHRPYAARTRVRSLRPPRGAATALATVLALLVLPGAAAGASESSPAPAPRLDELFQVETLMRQLEGERRKALRVVNALQAA